jgi:hypothetical protein
MPTSETATPDGKDRLRLLTPALLVLLAFLSFLMPSRPRLECKVAEGKDALVARMNSRLRDENFDRLYDEAADSVRRNVTREKFVRRMRAAAAKLKGIDGGLNFSRDSWLETGLTPDDSLIMAAAQKLEGNGKAATLLTHWDGEGKFYDLTVVPDLGTPGEYAFPSVSQQQFYSGGQLLNY